MSSEYDWSLYKADVALMTVGTSGDVVTGPVKVAQLFSAAFLTEVGSCPYNLGYGTAFMTYLRNSMIRTDQDVIMYFNEAATEASYYLGSQVTDDTPDDEVLTKVTLDHFELEPPYLFLYIILLTRAGTSRSIVLPVSSTSASATEDD